MYLVGKDHPNRSAAEAYLRANASETFVTSAETYQECVHRYVAIDRRAAIPDSFAILDSLADQIYPITREDVGEAVRIATMQPRLSGRDSLHVAVMERYELRRIFTFDRDFDFWPGIRRVPG
jgi:predicted nucleic acid-binding protein